MDELSVFGYQDRDLMKYLLYMMAIVCPLFGPIPAHSQLNNDPTIRGVAAYNNKNYNLAFRLLLKPALDRNPRARFFLGRMYIEGGGVIRKEKEKGYAYIKQSALKGNVNALWYLARQHSSGEVIVKDVPAAIRFAKILCKKNVLKACTFEANLLAKQPNVNNRIEACQRFSNLYRTEGEISAAMPLVQCINSGSIAPKNRYEVEKLLKISADAGQRNAQTELLKFYFAKNDARKIGLGAKLAYERSSNLNLSDSERSISGKFLEYSFRDEHCAEVSKFKVPSLVELVCKKALKGRGSKSNLVLASLYYTKESNGFYNLKLAEKYALEAVKNSIPGAADFLLKIWNDNAPGTSRALPLGKLANVPIQTICGLLSSTSFTRVALETVEKRTFDKINNSCSENYSNKTILVFATIYRDGFGDVVRYRQLLSQLCDKEGSEGCLKLGFSYIQDDMGGNAEEDIALSMFRKAALLGNADGAYQCYLIAEDKVTHLGEGSEGEENEEIKNDCFKRAVLLSHPLATVIWAEQEISWLSGNEKKRLICSKVRKLKTRKNLSASVKRKVEKFLEENSCR